MATTDHEPSTHEVAGRTPGGRAAEPPAGSAQDGADKRNDERAPDAAPATADGKPHQLKPDGR